MTAEADLQLPKQTLDAGDARVRAVLEKAKASVGFVPNMYAGMANAPGLLDTYLDGYVRFRGDSGFSPVEQEVVFLTISRVNGCDYCMAAHSMIAARKSGVPEDVLAALREGRALPDAKLEALARFTETMVTRRGRPTKADLQAFLDAGYSRPQVLEIVLAIAVKTLSNYSNHLNHPEVDAVFADFAVEPVD